MKKNVDVQLVSLEGESLITVGNRNLTIKIGLIDVLLHGKESNSSDYPAEEKLKDFELAKRIHAGGEVEFKLEELVSLKRKVSQGYGPLVVSQIYDWIEKE